MNVQYYLKQLKAGTTAWLAQSVERTTLSTSVLKSYGRGFEPRIGLAFFAESFRKFFFRRETHSPLTFPPFLGRVGDK